MRALTEAFDSAVRAVTALRATLARNRHQRQVRSQEERSIIRATGQSWFQSFKPVLTTKLPKVPFDAADAGFARLLELADQNASREHYLDHLETLKDVLVASRTQGLKEASAVRPSSSILEAPPDFSKLASDERMRSILLKRWSEISACVSAGACLAATVMMGGLLEGLLLARVLRLPDAERASIFKTRSCPKAKDGRALPLSDWTLRDYIAVAHELDWIGDSAKDLGIVVRDYRNFVHPQKEYSHGVTISERDARMFWAVSSSLAREIIESAVD